MRFPPPVPPPQPPPQPPPAGPPMGGPPPRAAPSQSLASTQPSGNGNAQYRKPRKLKGLTQLDLESKEWTRIELDFWVDTFKFTCLDATEGMTPYDKARMLLHNTEPDTSPKWQRLQKYVVENQASLEQAIQWIKDNLIKPVNTLAAERAALNMKWRDTDSRETLPEFKDRLLKQFQEVYQSVHIPDYEFPRIAERYLAGLPTSYQQKVLERGVGRDLEAIHAIAVAQYNIYEHLDINRENQAAAARDKNNRSREKSKERKKGQNGGRYRSNSRDYRQRAGRSRERDRSSFWKSEGQVQGEGQARKLQWERIRKFR